MHNLTRSVAPALFLAALALPGCDNTATTDTQPPITLPAVGLPDHSNAPAVPTSDDAIAHASNAFALDLYSQLAAKEGNLFFSPSSIHTALAMTYAGARGRTASQMAATMHYAPQDGPHDDAFHAGYGELLKAINKVPLDYEKKPVYQLAVANALWGQQGFSFDPGFLKTNEEHYDAAVESLDFQRDAEGARQTINQWVEDKTNDNIKDLIPSGVLNADTRLVLTNAIYFKADWAEQFSEHATKDGEFHATGGKVTVPMMHDIKPGTVLEADTFRAATLPYQGGELSMTIYLPREVDGLPALEKQMTLANLGKWQSQFKPVRINWTLPRWKFTSQFSLADTLAAMGMPDAFSNAADFSGMTSEAKLYISAVIHQAFIAVDEDGTEAAAATAVGMDIASMPIDTPVPFVVNRPFIFTIRHERTGAILFMGRVVNPAS